MTVKMYKNTQSKAYMASELYEGQWSLSPYGKNTDYYEGFVEEEAEFILPEGLRVALDQTDNPQFYMGNTHCPYYTLGNTPVVVGGKEIYLKRA